MAALNDVLSCYGELASTLAQMVELARSRDWQQLPSLDALCTGMVERLRTMDPEPLSRWERAHVEALADRIRADQQELASLVRPQFLRLMREVSLDASGQRNREPVLAAGSVNP